MYTLIAIIIVCFVVLTIVLALSWSIYKANTATTRFEVERDSYARIHIKRGRYIRYLEWKLKSHNIKYESEGQYDPEVEAFNQKMGSDLSSHFVRGGLRALPVEIC